MQVTRRHQIRSYGKKPIHHPLHPEKTKARQEVMWMKKYNLNLQGITWDSVNNRYYWNTHKLMVEHQ